VLIKTAQHGLLMDKTGLGDREGYGPPTPDLKYIPIWTLDVYTVPGYLSSRLPRISRNCPHLSRCIGNLQRSEDILPMYPVSFSRAKLSWAGGYYISKNSTLYDKYPKIFFIIYERNRSTSCIVTGLQHFR
jgi:hypothetical protein